MGGSLYQDMTTLRLILVCTLTMFGCVSELGDSGGGGGGGGGGGDGSGSGSGSGDGGTTPAGFVFGAYKDTSINMDWNTNVISTSVTGTRTPLVDEYASMRE